MDLACDSTSTEPRHPALASDRGDGGDRARPPSAGMLLHEVRTPLHAMLVSLELLLQGAAGELPLGVLRLLREIASAAAELERATDRLAHLASLWPASPARLEPVDPALVLRSAGLPAPWARPPTAAGERQPLRLVLAEPTMTVAALAAVGALFRRERDSGLACSLDDDGAESATLTVRLSGPWIGDPASGIGALDAEVARRTAALAGAVLELGPGEEARLSWRRAGPPSTADPSEAGSGPCGTSRRYP